MDISCFEDHKLVDKIPVRNRKEANKIADDWLKLPNRSIAIHGTWKSVKTVLDYRDTYQK